MTDKPAFVISDIHLGGVPRSTERAFRRFLSHVGDQASELLINGDLFDFWFEYRTVIQAQHYRVLAALTDLSEAGVRLRFVGGNHDAWGGQFLSEHVGMELLSDKSEIELAGRRALVVHGDGLGQGDLGYRALKKVIRNRASIRAFRLLHPDLGSRIARLVSTTESKHGTPDMANPTRAAELREWARDQMEVMPHLDLILAGHTHSPTVEEFRPGRYYVNTGDWLNHFTYLVVGRHGAPNLLRWDRDQ
jgi:UDP-2,3-diacylglucosamine hydrolase